MFRITFAWSIHSFKAYGTCGSTVYFLKLCCLHFFKQGLYPSQQVQLLISLQVFSRALWDLFISFIKINILLWGHQLSFFHNHLYKTFQINHSCGVGFLYPLLSMQKFFFCHTWLINYKALFFVSKVSKIFLKVKLLFDTCILDHILHNELIISLDECHNHMDYKLKIHGLHM